MIRSILFPLAEGPGTVAAREYAFWLAKQEAGRIHAVALIDVQAFEIPVLGTPDGFMPTVVPPPIEESRNLLETMTAEAREQLDQFAQECTRREIRCSTSAETGIPGEIVARQAVAHDMVVLSRTGYSRVGGSGDGLDDLVPEIIRGSIRPVLVAGSRISEGVEIRNVLVAYDGSVHAGRALTVAAALGRRPGVECTLITVTSTEERGNEILAPAEAYLYHHGASPRKRIVLGSRASEVICDLVASARTDVLVMGAFGHSPIREMIFGSTTERVLSHCGSTVILQS